MVPAIADAGFPEPPVIFCYGSKVATATPKPVIDRLNREFAKLLNNPAMQAGIDTVGGPTLQAWYALTHRQAPAQGIDFGSFRVAS